MSDHLATVPAHLIDAGDNDRERFGQLALKELAESIRANGLAQRPTLRPLPNGRYEIVAGERRTRAMTQILGWTEIPVMVREMDDQQASNLMLAENLQRVDLNPLEEARAYRKRMDALGIDERAVAELANVTFDKVRMRLALLRLGGPAAHLVETGGMTAGFAQLLVDLDPDRQRLAVRAFVEESPDWYAMDALTKRLLKEQQEQPLFDPDSFFQVESYVADAKRATRPTRAQIVSQLVAMVRLAEARGFGGDAEVRTAASVLDREGVDNDKETSR